MFLFAMKPIAPIASSLVVEIEIPGASIVVVSSIKHVLRMPTWFHFESFTSSHSTRFMITFTPGHRDSSIKYSKKIENLQ